MFNIFQFACLRPDCNGNPGAAEFRHGSGFPRGCPAALETYCYDCHADGVDKAAWVLTNSILTPRSGGQPRPLVEGVEEFTQRA